MLNCLFDDQIRKKWRDDLGIRYALLVSVQRCELIVAVDTLPKLAQLVWVETLLPLQTGQM
ncbi:MAG: hypothetical protein BGP05_04445 [Rhizobiales bacterium 62-47]|nr:MAG: hypothetical protein BGP05_04445 [Rhizobiales bacterium 62-47]